MPTSRPVQRVLPSRRDRAAARPAIDALDEFAAEREAASTHTVPSLATDRQSARLAHPAALIAGGAAVATLVLGVSLLRTPSPTERTSFIAPPPSPIDVEYPEYPGAPLLEAAAAAMPARLKAEGQVEQLSTTALAQTRPVVSAAAAPQPTASGDGSRSRSPSQSVEPEAARAFDVRGPAPQTASIVAVANPIATDETPRPMDSPPRRIGPPIAVTTLGGMAAKDGRVVLVLEVTEHGDVDRIVSREGVDVHPEVIDSVAAAARAWRYEPARRDGAPVPARVRVVVQLNGTSN
jgi:hypothetical protein